MGQDRRQHPEVRAARIAAVAAIAAAVISLGSGIVTYVSTQDQIAAEDKRSSADFIRNERKDAYVQFIADEGALRGAESTYYEMAFSDADGDGIPPKGTPDDLNAQEKIVDELHGKFLQSVSRVDLVGSVDARQGCKALKEVHGDVHYLITYKGESQLGDREKQPIVRIKLKSIEGTWQPNFVSKAQSDVGNG